MTLKALFSRHRAVWLAVGITCAALLTAAACARNPVTGQQELALMSQEQELALGARTFPKTNQQLGGELANDPRLQEYVSSLGQRLAALSHRPNLPWEFKVVNSSQVNAFALPGGRVGVTRGMLGKLRSEDELAFVLGHEVGHVTARHHVAQYSRSVLAGVLVAGVGVALADSELGGLGSAAAGLAGGLLLLSYSRDQERQADSLGYRYLVAGGYNPRGMLNVFEVFQSIEKTSPGAVALLLRSHPLSSERLATAKELLARGDAAIKSRPFKTDAFREALASQRRRAPAYAAMDRGDAFYKKGFMSSAERYYQQAIEIYDGEGLFHSRLALVRLKMGRRSDALAPARRGALLSPRVYLAQVVAAYAFKANGDELHAQRHALWAKSLLPQ